MRSATPNQALQTPLPSTLLSPASIFQFSLEPPHSLGVPLPHPLKKIVSFVSDVFYRVFRKNCVFCTIHCNPSLAYIAERDFQSSQRNASEQSLLLAGKSCTTNSSRVLARERWQTFENSWKKHNIY